MVEKPENGRWPEPGHVVSHPLAVVRAFAFRQAALEAHYRIMAAGIPAERREPEADTPLVVSPEK